MSFLSVIYAGHLTKPRHSIFQFKRFQDMNKYFTTIALSLMLGTLFAGNPIILQQDFLWKPGPNTISVEGQLVESWSFEGGVSSDLYPSLPFLVKRFEIDSRGVLTVNILEAEYESFPMQPSDDDRHLQAQLTFETSTVEDRGKYYGKIAFTPIIKKGSRYERLKKIKLQITVTPSPNSIVTRDPDNTDNSVLSDGTIYKIKVNESGVYKITYEFLNSVPDIMLDGLDPQRFQLFGNGGGKLPYYTEAARIDDLAENAIIVAGSSDGSFDPGDYILFYGEGPDKWSYREDLDEFVMEKNIYDNSNYYFLKVDGENGKRVELQPSQVSGSTTINTFDDFARLENDDVNLMYEWEKAQGSGKNWFGDHFKVAREYTYNDVFTFPNLINTVPVKVRARMALRARVSSNFLIEINGETLESFDANGVNSINSSSDNERDFASYALLADSLFLNNEAISFSLSYPYPQNPGDDSEGWLDYVQFNVSRQLRMAGEQMAFRNTDAVEVGNVNYELANASGNLSIWDITDPLAVEEVATELSGNTLRFAASTNELRTFMAFDPAQSLMTPEEVTLIQNQNLHSINDVDVLIIYHNDFFEQAQLLASHRAEVNGFNVALAEVEAIYNEFSSGRRDPTAIRDLARMLYDRNNRLQHLVLFGDASFDTRDIYGLGGDFVPVYQRDAFNPIQAYPTDDYYGILYGISSNDPLKGDITIAVGRLPAKNVEEAQLSVDKIIHYDSSDKTLGAWRNRLVFVGDDDDGVGDIPHYRDADRIADKLNEEHPTINLEKIYLDAYPQESTPGGERVPEATEDINKSIFKGALAVTYLGHGGAKGWAQERVLNISDILSWNNFDQMPIFVTATCSFTGYDDPTFTTAGEEVFLNSEGGAVALMTTTRAVFANANEVMTENALEYILSKNDGRPLTIGEAFRLGKNDISSSFDINNARKFALIGDPSMTVALPQYDVATTMVNSSVINPLDTAQADTLRALQRVTIKGEIINENGQRVENFNGIIYPTIFDKPQSAKTLGQGANTVYDYRIQKNVIFKGRASVSNGQFEFTFVVPKDINYEYGYGKISYYAANTSALEDAAGSYEKIVIGGTDANALLDDEGPKVEVFMNTEDFVFGGVTNPTPTLLVLLEDDNGINVVGNSIGHDLEGTLNDDTQNTLLLNDFYESDLDDYTKGRVAFPMSELEEGRHRISVKAWDVANNSAEGYTEFIVASSEEVVLEHVLNYPNPFTDRTCFQFDHNLANQELDILIQIYTISGRLVKTIQTTLLSDGALRQDDCIEWDGRDDYGGQLAKGVYLYKVKVNATNSGLSRLSGESDFEKLVILK
jgi:hypothetical protein